ncbi:S1 family peptidase [Chryseobacterium indoltheticum]|uniref:Serine protease n=1 Tax=Chryseobacterium indoltheticum TaxID=254 RepID=A0A3G6N4A4_9FLAO|nr:serine protease [Chryseobacterium indoltheticum]AZA60765.1 serine protease [Chryseobacterium indoltheticum]
MPFINGEYFNSTFNIITETENGTSFILTISEKQYLITAKHLFKGVANGEYKTFSIYINDILTPLSGKVYICPNVNVDIAVVPLEEHIIAKYEFSITGGNYSIGEDVFFFGYPYYLSQTLTNVKFKMPLVKTAIVSGVNYQDDCVQIYLDGHNNPGFSGGPVGYFNEREQRLHILSVISGYITQNNNIITSAGVIITPENSGIIISYSIKHVNDILHLNKI